MPRFFFTVCDDVSPPDLEGTILPNLAAAQIEAMRLMGALLKDTPETFSALEEWSIDVRNQDDVLLFLIQFSTVFAPAARIEVIPK